MKKFIPLIIALTLITSSCSVFKDRIKRRFCYQPFNKGMAKLLKKHPQKYSPYKVDAEGGVYKSNEIIVVFEDGVSITPAVKQAAMDSIGAVSWEPCNNCGGKLGLAKFNTESDARLAFEGVVQVVDKPTGIEGVEYNYILSDDILVDKIGDSNPFNIRPNNHETQVVVAVLDAGLSTSTIVSDKIYKGNSTCLGQDHYGWNFVDKNKDISDDHSHGTFVSSVIVQNTNLSSKYSILPVKVQDYHGAGTLITMLCGLEHALKYRKAKVVNISMGYTSETPSKYLMELIHGAPKTVFVTSTGNEGALLDNRNHYPSDLGLDNIIRVAAHQDNGDTSQLATFSNYYNKEYKTISAPGVDVSGGTPNWYCPGSTRISSRNCIGIERATKDGTSFSTAYVSAKIIDIINLKNMYNKTAVQIISEFYNNHVSSSPIVDPNTNTPFYKVN